MPKSKKEPRRRSRQARGRKRLPVFIRIQQGLPVSIKCRPKRHFKIEDLELSDLHPQALEFRKSPRHHHLHHGHHPHHSHHSHPHIPPHLSLLRHSAPEFVPRAEGKNTRKRKRKRKKKGKK